MVDIKLIIKDGSPEPVTEPEPPVFVDEEGNCLVCRDTECYCSCARCGTKREDHLKHELERTKQEVEQLKEELKKRGHTFWIGPPCGFCLHQDKTYNQQLCEGCAEHDYENYEPRGVDEGDTQ